MLVRFENTLFSYTFHYWHVASIPIFKINFGLLKY